MATTSTYVGRIFDGAWSEKSDRYIDQYEQTCRNLLESGETDIENVKAMAELAAAGVSPFTASAISEWNANRNNDNPTPKMLFGESADRRKGPVWRRLRQEFQDQLETGPDPQPNLIEHAEPNSGPVIDPGISKKWASVADCYREMATRHNLIPPDDMIGDLLGKDAAQISTARGRLVDAGWVFRRLSKGAFVFLGAMDRGLGDASSYWLVEFRPPNQTVDRARLETDLFNVIFDDEFPVSEMARVARCVGISID